MKLAFVTGTSRGLGQAAALAFRDAEWEVVELSRPAFSLQEAANQAEPALGAHTDRDWERAVLVNNAASMHIAAIGALDGEVIRRELDTNVIGQVTLATVFFRLFPRGRLINISSGAAVRPIEHWALYCIAKAATEMYVKTASLEGYDAVNFQPGIIDTDMQGYIRSTNFPAAANFQRLSDDGKLRDPAAVAQEIVRLAGAS